MIVVVMGPAGAGKSTVADGLAKRLGWPFIEGDTFHPTANIAKMQGGAPLDDVDRRAWLAAVAAQIARWREAGVSGVLTCSALKRAYRDVLRAADRDLAFVYLDADEDLLRRRVSSRSGHFMPPELVASQIATLEPPGPDEAPIVLSAREPLESQLDEVVAAIAARHGRP
jgi:gluconokinase